MLCDALIVSVNNVHYSIQLEHQLLDLNSVIIGNAGP